MYDASPRTCPVSRIAVRNDSDSITIAASSTTIGTHHQRLVSSESSGIPWVAWSSCPLW